MIPFIHQVVLICAVLLVNAIHVVVSATSHTVDIGNEQQDTIFYNVFIPSKPEDEENAIAIVKEQIGQISAKVEKSTNVYFTILGNVKSLTNKLIQSLCASNKHLHCIQHIARTEGDELITLNEVKSFCDVSPGKTRVTYLHNKGSFHFNEDNNQWRRALTAAAISKECFNPPKECNLCGLQFYTQFAFLIPGNMWTAECAYIKKLLPIEFYKEKRLETVQATLLAKLRGLLRMELFDPSFSSHERVDFYGMDRFAMEHWVASHPDVIPCDMDPLGNLPAIMLNITSIDDLSWSLAPRNHGFVIGHDAMRHFLLMSDKEQRLQEYYLLAGNILKWYTLYDTAPKADSWIWIWFPDGAMWKEATQIFGNYSIETVLDRLAFRNSAITVRTSFSSDTVDIENYLYQDKVKGTVIFFHITIPSFEEMAEYAKAKINLEEQFRIIDQSYAGQYKDLPITVFYTVGLYSNPMAEPFIRSLCDQFANIKCMHMRTLERDFNGETLFRVNEYCDKYPDSNVIYLTNEILPEFDDISHAESTLFKMTKAVTGKVCFTFDPNVCDTCGLIFYQLWTLFYPGNIFRAQCKYINKLLPPDVFEKRMEDFVGTVLIERLRAKLLTKIFPDDAKYFGLDRSSISHWIGSHPTIRPCDVVGPHISLESLLSNDTEFELFEPKDRRESLQAPFDFNSTLLENVLKNETMRFREFSLLPGHVIKWHHLYGSIPPKESWIWNTFPDGKVWRDGYKKHKQDVLIELVAKYMPEREEY